MDRIVDMFQRVGMDDEVERGGTVRQAMNVYFRIGEDMPIESMEDWVYAAGFVDFQNGLRRPPFDNFLQQTFVLKVSSDRIWLARLRGDWSRICQPGLYTARISGRFQKPSVLICAAFETTVRGPSDGPPRAAIETYHEVAEGN